MAGRPIAGVNAAQLMNTAIPRLSLHLEARSDALGTSHTCMVVSPVELDPKISTQTLGADIPRQERSGRLDETAEAKFKPWPKTGGAAEDNEEAANKGDEPPLPTTSCPRIGTHLKRAQQKWIKRRVPPTERAHP